MLEPVECYQLGTYTVPDSFKQKLKAIDLNSGPRLARDGLGEQSYTAHFPMDTSLNLQEGFYGLFIEHVADFMVPIIDEAHAISIDMVNKIFPGYVIVRGGFAALVPPGVQPLHQDPRVFHRFCKRIHLPVITNPGVSLVIDDNNYHLPENTVWAFDNLTKLHRSQNLGSEVRYHILVDVIPRDRLEFVLQYITGKDMYALWHTWAGRKNKELLKVLDLEKENTIPLLT